MQLLPRDEKFFDLLIEQAHIVFSASKLLTGASGGPAQADCRVTAQQIRDLERRGDEAARQIYRRLHQTFITPIDPEDIHQLAMRISEIVESLDAVAYR